MTTTIQPASIPPSAAIYAHEATALSALALALVAFADQVRLGPQASAQRRDLKASASRARLFVGAAGSSYSARRRRNRYQRAREHVASFAFALLDLQGGAQIAGRDFDLGRALAARGKALLDAQMAALQTVSVEAQEDVCKLDELMLAADRAASTVPVESADAAAAPRTAEVAPLEVDGYGDDACAAPMQMPRRPRTNGGLLRTDQPRPSSKRRSSLS
jgi:hypothetical protein